LPVPSYHCQYRALQLKPWKFQGSLPAALDSHKASLAIADRLAKADPGNAGCQRDLSVSAYEITAGMVSTSGALQLRISISRSRP